MRHLKKANLTNSDLAALYKEIHRPAIEYCAPTYHSMLTNDQCERLERLQMKALKTVYGWEKSYSTILEMSGIERLSKRRCDIFMRFANKCSRDTRFADWFPPALVTGHDTRSRDRFLERKAKNERLRKSPVFTMIRELNRENGLNKK